MDCTTGSLNFAVKEVTSPVNHVLITATNTGSGACRLYGYPAPALSESAQAETARIGESNPQAVVTLDRGATAYAGLITATPDRNSDSKVTTSSIGLSPHGPDAGDLADTSGGPRTGARVTTAQRRHARSGLARAAARRYQAVAPACR